MESSHWLLLSLKRTGIPGNVEGSCLSASHGFSQLVLLHNKDGKEPCCHEEGASQWQRSKRYVPADAEGFPGALASELEVHWGAAISKEQFSVPL